MAEREDREQRRERLNTMRVVGGLLIVVALLVYFFHLAEAPMGGRALGALALALSVAGAVLLWIGWRRLRAME
jgi:Na+/melibiose symporter-like transporter